MPPRVRPYTEADLIPNPPRVRLAHVGRILTPPVAAATGEYLHRVQVLPNGTAEARVLPDVRELVSPTSRSSAGRLGPGDVVIVQQLSRALWVITGLLPNPQEWAVREPDAALQVGNSGLVIAEDGWVLHDDETSARAQGGRFAVRSPRVRIDTPDLRVDGAGLRIAKVDGEPLSLWADALLLRSTDPWPGGLSFRQLDLSLSSDGIRLSFDADVPHAGGNHFLAVINADGWAAATAEHTRGYAPNWGDIVDLITDSIRPVTVSLVDGELTAELARSAAPAPAQVMEQIGTEIVQLDAPTSLRLTVAGGRTDFTWDAVADAGSYRMEWAIYDGDHVYLAGHPAIDSLPAATFGFPQPNRPPVLGLEKVFFDQATRALSAAGGGSSTRIVDASAFTPDLTYGPAFLASVAAALAQSLLTGDGRRQAGSDNDYARVLGFCWRVRAVPADLAAHSESDCSE